MKKLCLLFLIGGTFLASAQETETTEDDGLLVDRKHEIRIDAVEGLIVPAIDLGYEYVIGKNSGAGISVFINLDSEEFQEYQKFAITPYYRQYFFNKKDYGARGFFAEGVLQYGSGRDGAVYFDSGNDMIVEEDWSAFGIGFALGQKWVSKNGFIVEISAGGGRYFGSDDTAPEAFFRGGVSVGYRF